MRPVIAALLLCAGALPSLSQTPTFARDIAPIIYSHCAPCHRPTQPGPFPLLSYPDVRKHARQIAAVTTSRYMPPWLPEGLFGQFEGDRRLTDTQIRLIADWVKAGAPEGDATVEPATPKFPDGWQLGPPDLVLTTPKPFRVPAAGPDQFWNFIYKPQLTAPRYVRAIEIHPGTKNVHHANLILDRTGASRRREHSPGSGFGGMDFTVDRNPLDPDSHFLFWKPGTVPYSEPDGFSWVLAPGNLLVLNTHLQPSGKPEDVQPTVGIYFTDKPPTKLPILVELEADEKLSIPPGNGNFTVGDTFTVPIDCDVLAIYPHAHYLGNRLQADATLPNGSRVPLIHIPHWDLSWQAVYRYQHPVFLPRGSVISMTYSYDNSSANVRNPNNPPKRVEAGNSATDEMSHLWLQLLPHGHGDQRRIIQEAMAQHRLSKNPNDYSAWLNLGAIRLSRLDPQAAEPALRKAVALDPAQPEGHDMLGLALRQLGQSAESLHEFQLAVEHDPQYMDGRYNLAKALAARGDYRAALKNLRVVAAAYPNVSAIQDELRSVQSRAAE